MSRLTRFLLPLMALGMLSQAASSCKEAEPDRVAAARENVQPQLGAFFGLPVFIRIVKESWLLELWVQHEGTWQILKTYPIAGMSGTLGPKQAEGDEQAPEGFYDVVPERLTPRSRYHLGMNIGYPNAYDLSLGRTGSFIMIHGGNESVGCFAMTDEGIEEIYSMVYEAFRAGQKRVEVHIYPFEMTDARMQREKDSPHTDFWRSLQARWQHTHDKHEP